MERGSAPLSPAAAISALQWWSDAGVDMLVDEEPRDWLRPVSAPETRPIITSEPASEPALPLAREPVHAPLPAAAPAPVEALPDRLDLFQAHLLESPALPFAAPSAPRVGPSGDPAAGLMVLIDMPAAEDFAAGQLLSGEAGRLFDRMMAAIGRDRSSLYLASLSPLRSPDGRFPEAAARSAAAIARHHIALAQPRAVLLMGGAAARVLTGEPAVQARGRWHAIQTKSGSFKALVTLPPSYLLEQPKGKPLAWADLQMLVEGLTQ